MNKQDKIVRMSLWGKFKSFLFGRFSYFAAALVGSGCVFLILWHILFFSGFYTVRFSRYTFSVVMLQYQENPEVIPRAYYYPLEGIPCTNKRRYWQTIELQRVADDYFLGVMQETPLRKELFGLGFYPRFREQGTFIIEIENGKGVFFSQPGFPRFGEYLRSDILQLINNGRDRPTNIRNFIYLGNIESASLEQIF